MTPSTTDDPTLLVHAYLDGELDPAHALDMERRIAADPALAAVRDRVQSLRDLVRDRLPRECAPAALEARIKAAVGIRRGASRPSWPMLAAAAALAAVLASGVTWVALRTSAPDQTANMVLASHMRALMAPQPIDVSSSDRHTVKPWFNGRIPQSPQVVDLTNEGFPLVGGRIDIIGRAPVPSLVYRHRQHLISLTAIPGVVSTTVQQTIVGYNVVTWTDGGVAYWAVSDLGIADLETFARAFRAAAAEN